MGEGWDGDGGCGAREGGGGFVEKDWVGGNGHVGLRRGWSEGVSLFGEMDRNGGRRRGDGLLWRAARS